MHEEFIKVFNKVTSSISFICMALTSYFGIEWILFLGYLILNILDYITGSIKSRVKKTENSQKGLIGIIKKVCYWVLICISFLLSFLLVKIGSKININLEFIFFFGWFTLACLIVNETRSIIENLVEIGITVPYFFKKGLEVYENILNNALKKLNTNNNEKPGQ